MAGRKKKDDAHPKPEKDKTSSSPGPGHNAHAELTDDEQRSLMIHHVKFVVAAKKTLATANSALRNLYKKAKADGVTKSEIEEYLQLKADGGEALLKAQIERSMKLARWNGLSIGEQAGFDFSQADRRPAEDKAFELGKIAGMEGSDRSPPYHPGSPQGQRWIEGWDAGQAANRDMLAKMNTPKPDDKIDANDPKYRDVVGMPGAEAFA